MISRRNFLRYSALGMASVAGGGLGYGFWEAAHIRIERQTVPVRHLSPAFAGKTVAVLTDFHHGPFVSLDFIRSAVQLTNELNPDLIALVGDFAHKGHDASTQLPPCLEVLSALRAPLGIFAVPGNHDLPSLYRSEIKKSPLVDLTNQNRRIVLGDEKLYVAGVDDLWWGRPNNVDALFGVPPDAPVLMLSHNPDWAEEGADERVSLMLSGHTHGGQIYLRGLGSNWVPSRYGLKYRCGLVQGPKSPVFISRGLGEAGVPLRVNVPPEINLLTLAIA